MATISTTATGVPRPFESGPTIESVFSAMSWPAVIGGAVVAASVTLVLLVLGSGLGLASLSFLPGAGASATTFTIGAAIWLILVQWLSSGLGGYITGRLRTRWTGTHTHEVFFRDTAHGFLTWALATLIGALVLSSAASLAIGTGSRAAATVASGAAQGAGAAAPAVAGATPGGTSMGAMAETRAYDVDKLFRGEKPEMAATGQEARREVTRILANGLREGDMPAADRTYLAQTISARTGQSEEDAQKRIDEALAQEKAAETKARQAADAARKAALTIGIVTALSMVIGAFIASVAAAFGGSLRDEHP